MSDIESTSTGGQQTQTAPTAKSKRSGKNNKNNEGVTPNPSGDLAGHSQWKDPKTWPKSLHDFISRSFKLAGKKKLNPDQLIQFKNQLKKLINIAISSGKILDNDWSKQELPLLTGAGSGKLILYCDKNNMNLEVETRRKRTNIFGEDESSSEDDSDHHEKVSKKTKSLSLGNSVKKLKMQKRAAKPSPKSEPKKVSSKSGPALSEAQRLELRSKRFERELSAPIGVASQQSQISTEPIVGKNPNLEKKYLRLTSQPKPETVRPLSVLRKTLQLLCDKYLAGASYNYLCDQCKSLRQDLTVQNIKCDFSILAYEFHSKIAIENGDWGEFNQCQSQLKLLYDDPNLHKPNYFEFLAYRVLYYILTNNDNEVYELELFLVNNGISEIEDEFLRYALDLFRYTSTTNYYSLSQTVNEIYRRSSEEEKSLPKSAKRHIIESENGLLLQHGTFYYFQKFLRFIIERENIRTLSILCCGYKQLPIDLLKNLLSLEEEGEFQAFCKQNNLLSFINDTNTIFNCAQARASVSILKNKLFSKIDIKGQV